MKLTSPWLPSAMTLSSLFLAGSVAGSLAGAPVDEVAFKPSEGLALTRTFTTAHEMVLDDMSITMNGQPFTSPEMDMNMRMNATIVVSDEFASVSGGRVSVLKRNYETIQSTGAVNVESPMMPESVDETIDSESELEGKSVIFTWNEDDSSYVATFPDDSGDTDLLDGLEQDMDLTVLLPSGSVSVDDTWSIDVEKMRILLMPGGDLSLLPQADDVPDGFPGMDSMSGNMADMLGEIDGEATGEYRGKRDVDGVECGVIVVKISIQSAADLSDKLGDAMDALPEGMQMEMNHMDVEMELEGEGTLLWNLAAGHAHSFELSAMVTTTMDMGMSIDAGAGAMDMEQTMEMSGSLDFSAAITRG